MNKQEQHFRDLTKLVMLFESFQIQLDKVKDNPKVYRHSLKNKLNSLEKDLDKTLSDALGDLYSTDEELYRGIREGLDHFSENVTSNMLEWLHIHSQEAVSSEVDE